MIRRCAIIPAYNEESNLALLIKKIKAHNVDIIIIDDGSTDRTAAIAREEGVLLIRHPSNQGKGGALRDGFRLALKRDYDQIITLDSDGQHNPEEVPLFIKKISNSKAGIVVGNRLHLPKGMPSSRLSVNRLFSKIVSFICKQNIPDALCGYRIIKKEVLESINLHSDRFDIDPEILIKAAKKGFKIESVNIESVYAGEYSQIRPLQDGLRFFRLIIKETQNE